MDDAGGPPYRGVAWDDVLEAHPRAIQAKTRGAFRLDRWLRRHAADTPLRLALVVGFHRTVFGDVFPDLAGRLRGPAPHHVPVNVQFGPYRGVDYENVLMACERLFTTIDQHIQQLDTLRTSPDIGWVDAQTLKAAAFLHCELVRIHPFVNGNGRIARICINYYAWRFGMLPIALERPKHEYTDAVESWLRHRRIARFEDFLRPIWRRRPPDSH